MLEATAHNQTLRRWALNHSIHEIKRHLISLGMPKEGIAYVLTALTSPPARRVQSGGYRNTPVHYASREMREAIGAESVTGEVGEVLECEYAREYVLRYVDQPRPRIPLEGTRADGRHLKTKYTPDYLKVCRDGVFVVEVKDDKKLRSLCRKRPEDWRYIDGTYHYFPAERKFKKWGITYVVRPVSSYHPVRMENLHLLIQARKAPVSPKQNKLRKRVLRHLNRVGAVSLHELSESLGIIEFTPILHLILSGDVIANLTKSRLSIPESAWIATSPEDLVAVEILNEQFFPTMRGKRKISINDVKTEKQAKSAARNLAQLHAGKHATVTPRTLRRFKVRPKSGRSCEKARWKEVG